ncbi:hypothetical protein M0R45_006781 [Rubus argutus]|uniref:Uncharacterized protein n=1 Tax=Rubus argutus TaxID=59490 RepID=A0AAW1YRT1_RUBAR
MEDEPLPPGVQSLPKYSSNPVRPDHHFNSSAHCIISYSEIIINLGILLISAATGASIEDDHETSVLNGCKTWENLPFMKKVTLKLETAMAYWWRCLLCAPRSNSTLPRNLGSILRKVRDRGILKDDSNKDDLNLKSTSAQQMEYGKLPPGWVRRIWKSQWEKACCKQLLILHIHHLYPSQKIGWRLWMKQQVTSITTIQRHMYHNGNTRTHHRKLHLIILFIGMTNHVSYKQKKINYPTKRCMGCGGWGVGLVQMWGYCNHCTRILDLPQSQYLATSLNFNRQTKSPADTKG